MLTKWMILLLVLCLQCEAAAQSSAQQTPKLKPSGKSPGRVTLQRTTYKGWTDAFVLSNEQVEVVVVPAVGRIMQFQFKGEEGPFWENSALLGRPPDSQSTSWLNFGGDKTWPAPQSDWPTVMKRAWPPPPAFDAMPLKADWRRNVLQLVSPIDPHYGIRTRRSIELDPRRSVLRITTAYEKAAGHPSRVSVWVITQLKDPMGVYIPVPKNSIYPEGFTKQSAGLPTNLKVQNGILSLTRDADANRKIGSDAETLLWVGEKQMLRMESPRAANVEYPDKGSSVEVYTNQDPAKYVELEMLGPLRTLKVGDKIRSVITYTLLRRSEQNPADEVRKALAASR